MNTKFWGPAGWQFLHTITFNYPEKVKASDPDDQERKKYTKQLFENLRYTLPCKYCRESFKVFLKELPIDASLGGRRDIVHWLYQIHNKVNAKLRKQEEECVNAKLDELEQDVERGRKTWKQAHREFEEFVHKTMITDEDPTFEEVCHKYESQRAGCTNTQKKKKSKAALATCRVPDGNRRQRNKTG